MRKTLIACAIAMTALSVDPAVADPPNWAPAHGHRAHQDYDARGRYIEPRAMRRSDTIWRGRDGRYYCRRENGSTGLVIGAAVGALAGHELAGRGDKTLGTILGAAGGALLGRAVDRGDLRCR